MKILITGGMGFIGSSLVRYLTNNGTEDQIVIVDDLSCGNPDFLKDIQNKFIFYKIDITDKENLKRCFEKERPEVVIHLAALHYIPECNQYPEKTIQINLIGTHNLISLSNECRVKHFIFASSASVYGASREENREDFVPSPFDIYGCSKLGGEQFIKSLCKTNWSVLRFFNTIGKNETHDHLIPSIFNQLKKSDKLTLGNMETKRDYIFVEDLVRGVVMTIGNKNAYSEIINLGTGMGTSVLEIVKIIESITHRKIEVVISEKLTRAVDNPVLIASIEKAKSIIDWEPKSTLVEALKEMF